MGQWVRCRRSIRVRKVFRRPAIPCCFSRTRRAIERVGFVAGCWTPSARVESSKHFQQIGDPEIETTIAQQEMAFRMQSSVPELTDVSGRIRKHILDLVRSGSDEDPGSLRPQLPAGSTHDRARRAVHSDCSIEAGTTIHDPATADLPGQCFDIDQPCAALIQDLKQRGPAGRHADRARPASSGARRSLPGQLWNDRQLRPRPPPTLLLTAWLAGGGDQGRHACTARRTTSATTWSTIPSTFVIFTQRCCICLASITNG